MSEKNNIQPMFASYDFIIVGGGVYGLCIAYYLSKNTKVKTLLLQQFEIGHSNGSSHSPTRITRSTYEKQLYRDLNLKALAQNWKQMQTILGGKFVYQTPYIYYDQQTQSYNELKLIAHGQSNFAFMSPIDVCKNYPGMPLINSKHTPIIDLKAGILAADDFITMLTQYLKQDNFKNLTIKENTRVNKIEEDKEKGTVLTQSGWKYTCGTVIVSSGRWVGELVPEFKGNVNVVKQYVSYLELKDMGKYSIQKFYSFYYKETDDLHLFSMADHKQWGVKLGRHNLSQLKPQEDTLEYQHAFFTQKANQIFGQNQFIKINKIQNCYYTITPSHDFVLDYVNPQLQRVFVVSCCSGHGFKFSTIIGDIVAQLLASNPQNRQKQTTRNQVYNKWSHMFKLAYHQGVNLN